MNSSFNEDSRVKIPAILHLTRLGYEFIDHRNYEKRTDCNIFIDIFQESILRLNPDLEKDEIPRIMDELSLLLNYEDLGEAFYRRIQRKAGILLVDFEDFERNSFHVVTELSCKNEDEEFRPDITILVNGMPLVFIEVKKPNNTDGILAERERINKRFLNPKFRRFINLTQMILYSNNMEYDDNSTEPIQGAFYSTTSTDSAIFHLFREEENLSDYEYLLPENEDLMDMILRNNNLTVIKHSPEFVSNRVPSTPTNRLLTSLLKKDRLAFFLEYGIAYVREGAGKPEKHIMRYPQVFATKAIASKLDKGIKKGIIWHTQGSGKTALAFYNVHHLTDYYHKIKVVPKFYFIVDRLDLAMQATKEFTIRGLHVVNVDSKEEFKSLFQKVQVRQNVTGTREITVVNIQKFKDDTEVLDGLDYDLSIQKIYFLDEVHRSYKETGSFLVNLLNSDRDAVMIGLTGTPIIQTDRTKSTKLFGGYIHKYYYNSSIADGYTLRLIREGIESNYKMQLENVLKDIQVLKGDSERRFVYSHKKFVEPMLDYIIDDFTKSRDRLGDATIGGMVVCDSSDQAKALYDLFLEKYSQDPKPEEIQSDRKTTPVLKAASPKKIFKLVDSGDLPKKSLKAKLILHDIGTKDTRKEDIEAFTTQSLKKSTK